MAATLRQTPNAFVSEVARYLALDPEDVRRLIRLDRLPALKLKRTTRTVHRIPLRDFHEWLLLRAENPVPALRDYPTFLADFDLAARSQRAA